jgi:hypothetical protein
VWLLIVFLVGAFIYAVRVIGPRVAPAGHVISQRQTRLFILMITLLWLATDWPMHDIAEEYLYSVHMVQHLTLSYFVPPLALMCVPEWMFRLLIGTGRTYRVVRFATKPVVAGVAFNLVVMITHIPKLVNLSAGKGPLHYSLHILLVTTALMFWSPVCGPLREWQLKPGGKMILECPNLITACQEFLRDPDKTSQPGPEGQRTMWVFYGDPRWQDPLMVHRWGYTPYSLALLLKNCGLTTIKQEAAQYKLREPRDMRVTGLKPFSQENKTPSFSYKKMNYSYKLM